MNLLFSAAKQIALTEGQTQTWEQLLRLGTFSDPRYGRFEITSELFQALIKNFQAGTYGQKILANIAHDDTNGAAGEITALRVQGDWLMAQIDWTPFGIDAVRNKRFIYLSAEYADNWQDNETGGYHGPVLLGSALTIRPVIKRQKGIQLSEDQRLLVDPDLLRQASMKLDEQKLRLQQELAALKTLSELVIAQLITAYETAGAGLEEATLEALRLQFVATGKTLAETKPEQKIELAVTTGGGLTKDEVLTLLQERETAQAAIARQLTERTATLCKIYMDAVEAEKGLPEDVRKLLTEDGVKVIHPGLTEEGIKILAAVQIKLGQQLAASRQLTILGYPRPAGSVHITLDETNNIKSLQETIDRRLRLVGKPDGERYRNTNGQLQAANKELAELVLAKFDGQFNSQLHQEYKQLAGGSGLQADVAVPKVWERTVIREALYQLIGLSFVNSGTVIFGAEHVIPYSYRDSTAAGIASVRVYEGGAIQNAGVIQTTDTAYPIPQKLAFEISDEMRYLTQAQQLDWDTLVENTNNAIRIINEDTERLIFNEIQQASDAYSAVNVTTENLELQANNTLKIFILAGWPVCRPRKLYDLKGSQIGSTIHPITVTYNSVPLAEWPGVTTNVATYYVLDYNLGEIRLVDKDGALVTPADSTAYTISYSYTTNVAKFDTDLGSLTTPAKWDTFLTAYALRKAVLEDQRYQLANFGLCSGAVFSLIEQAAQFGANNARLGTDLLANGNLGRIKDVANSKAIAPGLWMADQRVIIGERGITRFRMSKPWSMYDTELRHDSNGNFIGKQGAYGDQWIVLHTPIPLRRAYTSIVLYSGTGRVARAA